MIDPVISQHRRNDPLNALRWVSVAALAMMTAACGGVGDFGRQEPSFFRDTMVPATRNVISDINGYTSSEFDLTRDEENLRAQSATLKEYAGPSLERDIDEWGAELGVDERDYERERRIEHSTGVAVLNADEEVRTPEQILAAIAAELDLIDTYELVVTRVYEADKSRLRSLRQMEDVPGEDVVSTNARITENRELVNDTILAIHNRIDDYEIEKRRSLLQHPGDSEQDMSNAVGRLAHRVHKLERLTRDLTDPEGVEQSLGLAG